MTGERSRARTHRLRLLAVVAAAAIVSPAAAAQGDLLQWLRDNALVVRSIDAADDDYTDLAGLVGAIGEARIVQLGESSHGAGATFAAKVRLVEFLHQRMGFDVLVWESGMFDVDAVDADLRAGVETTQARRGIFGIWSETAEVAPLFAYAARSHASERPLHMAGFDMQFSGRANRYGAALADFFGGMRDPTLRDQGVALAEDVVGAYGTVSTRREDGPIPTELEHFLAVTDELIAFAVEQRDALVEAHGEWRTDFIVRTLRNLRVAGQNAYLYSSPGFSMEDPTSAADMNAAWNRRDARNAGNLLWLADDYYRGNKLIVWAHNGHIMNAYYAADWASLAATPQDGGMKPVGVFLQEAIGDDAYTIGFTAYTGEQRQQAGPDVLPVPAAPEGSLEHALHQLGEPYLFVDFRQLDDQPDHWLRRPMTMAIRGYMPEQMPDWTRVVDGMFFIDTMTPSTPLPRR
ncbi:MAG: erythromycin esterase family protein [Acidobacteriota bacterium]